MPRVDTNRSQVAAASGLDVLAGLWLFLSPWILVFRSADASSNNFVLGAAITILAAIRFFGAYRAAWLSWINVVLGIWVLLSPWILGFYPFYTATWNNVILGIIVTVLAAWSALATSATDYRTRTTGPDSDYTNMP